MIKQKKNLTFKMICMTDADWRYNMTREYTIKKLYDAIENHYVDEVLIPYLKKYNKLKNTYTTSSCAGRILILGLDSEEHKKPELFVGKWHRTVRHKEIFDCLENNKFEELWLKQEPFIIHIVVKDIDTAEKVLLAKKTAGVKRGGIINIKEGRIVIEILGSSYMSMPVKLNNKIIFNKKQLAILIKKANIKVKRNYTQLWKFLKILYKEMKQ